MKLPLLTAALLLSPLALTAQMEHTPGHMEKAPVPPSKSLTITFQGRTTVFSVEDLLKLPQVTLHVHNAHRNTDEEYTGPLLADVLARAGLSSAHENEALILHSSIVATATDHYFVLYSAAEVEPAFSKGQVIVAVMKHDLPDTEGGIIQLINSSDAKPARWVHGLANINVMSLAPTN
ncbi:MAG: hypothetical protein V4555_17040 [Acidobacteriota bacterium]